jgi:hypothetical protein
MASRKSRPTEHVFIPDTQVHPGVPTDHLVAAGNYIAARKPDVIVHIGDHWDMPSLSSYEDKRSAYFHDKSYAADVQAGNRAMDLFMGPIRHAKGYKPRMVFCMGNHENRIDRAIHADPVLKGTISTGDLNLLGWEVHKYLHSVDINGIRYCHLFHNPQSLMGGALGGTIDNRLNKLKHSFSQGHQQTRLWGTQYTGDGREIMGLVAGSFYIHDESYRGPQSNRHHWRGIVYKHEVRGGRYDPLFISLDYLLREWL